MTKTFLCSRKQPKTRNLRSRLAQIGMKEKDKWWRGGRPEMKPEEKATKIVQARFTQAEYDQLLERKAKIKIRNMSDFVRAVCLNKPMRLRPVRTTYQDHALSLLQEMRYDVLRIGVNVNQAAKRINSATDYHDLQREINSMTGDMSRFDAQLQAVMASIAQGEQPTE